MKIIKAAFWAALIVCDIKNTICFINFAQFDFSIIQTRKVKTFVIIFS